MRIRHSSTISPIGLTLAALLTVAFAGGCSKSSKKSSDDGDDDDDDDIVISTDGDPEDDYRAVYRATSQTETAFGTCEGAETAVTGIGQHTLFALETVWRVDVPNEYELWLQDCENEQSCDAQAVGFVFPEKTDGVWGGVSSSSLGDSFSEEGKCDFSYTEHKAELDGESLVITTSTYSGAVAPLGNGKCGSVNGGDADIEDYAAIHTGKLACTARETIVATRVGDFPEK